MKIQELIQEQQTIGGVGTTSGITQTIGQPPAAGQGQNPSMSGNVQALSDPKLQAATLAQQKQDREQKKKEVADQIKSMQQQLQNLQKQQQDLNKLQ
jgi:hypothetical protein